MPADPALSALQSPPSAVFVFTISGISATGPTERLGRRSRQAKLRSTVSPNETAFITHYWALPLGYAPLDLYGVAIRSTTYLGYAPVDAKTSVTDATTLARSRMGLGVCPSNSIPHPGPK